MARDNKLDNKLYRLQRYLVYLLRHHPDELGLTLGKDGFVEIELLLERLHKKPKYSWVSKDTIQQVIESQTDKQRLQVEGSKIRTRYGHSAGAVEEIGYEPAEPPEHLYHGTPYANLRPIRDKGLLPVSRKYVHLSDSEEQARNVGTRHSKQVSIVVILAREAVKAGIEFYHPEPLIWLVETVPSQFLEISDS